MEIFSTAWPVSHGSTQPGQSAMGAHSLASQPWEHIAIKSKEILATDCIKCTCACSPASESLCYTKELLFSVECSLLLKNMTLPFLGFFYCEIHLPSWYLIPMLAFTHRPWQYIRLPPSLPTKNYSPHEMWSPFNVSQHPMQNSPSLSLVKVFILMISDALRRGLFTTISPWYCAIAIP